MIDIEAVKQERANVVQNIANLEAQIGKLTQELQQANTNLIASRGAVMAFDRVLEVVNMKAPVAPQEAAPHIVE